LVDESEVLRFFKDHEGQASLDEVSKGLSIPKYGPESAYIHLLMIKLRKKLLNLFKKVNLHQM
jgi:hypothetical protein